MFRFLILGFILFQPYFLLAQAAIDLDLIPALDCNSDQICVDIQASSSDGTDLEIGTSSIFLTYESLGLSYISYTPQNFDDNDLCANNTNSAWDTQAFDASIPGAFNLTLILANEAFSCPKINGTPVTIGTICFSILDMNADPNIQFEVKNTNFNQINPNNGTGALTKGNFVGLSGTNLLDCSSIVPDLIPNFAFNNLNYSDVGAEYADYLIININETKGGTTTGQIKFFVSYSSGFNYEFDPNQTTALMIATSIEVNNSHWTMETTNAGLLFYSTTPIDSLERSSIALRITPIHRGTMSNLTISILPNQGGETDFSNNVAILALNIQN